MDTLALTQKCETLRHQTHSAEMSWVRYFGTGAEVFNGHFGINEKM